jgi:hypothetical protein
MKSVSASVFKVISVIMLCELVFLLGDCSTQQKGETIAHGDIRHQRNVRISL